MEKRQLMAGDLAMVEAGLNRADGPAASANYQNTPGHFQAAPGHFQATPGHFHGDQFFAGDGHAGHQHLSDADNDANPDGSGGGHGPGCGCGACCGGHDHDHTMLIDVAGNEYFADPEPILAPDDVISDTGGGATVAAIGGVPGLSSKPGADQTIFLDFDGHIVENTYWNSRNGGAAIHAQPYSTDADPFTFTTSELDRIEEIFRRVAEDFAPFDVNVTTVDPGVAAFTQGGTAIRTIISTDTDSAAMGGTGNRWYENAGGVAYLNSFGWSSDTPVWVFENALGNGNEKLIAEAASHEVGHAFGLRHDGTSSTGYYRGHGDGETGWASIMGVGYYESLSQWNDGSYADANNAQDDLAIIASWVGYESDLAGDTIDAAAELLADATGSFDVGGLIERTDDVDMYTFTTGGGEFGITASPFDLDDGKANLDILLTLADATGSIIASANPVAGLAASIELALDAGQYFVSVDGVGAGDPMGTGYTDYGSLGWFSLVGQFVPDDAGGSNGGGGNDGDGGDTNETGAIDFVQTPDVTYGGTQDRSGDSTVVGRYELQLGGNTWRQVPLDYQITENTVLEFDFASTTEGEIHGIGFDSDNAISGDLTFNIHGTQNWGIRDAATYGGGGYESFVIPVGRYYTGSASSLFFVNDDDAAAAGNGAFRNVRVYEADPPPNEGPDAVDDSAATVSGGSVTIDVLTNDTDPDGDTITIVDVSGASGGNVAIDGDTIVYTAGESFVGTDTFNYVIDDGRGGTDVATVTVTVDQPVVEFLTFSTNDVRSYGINQDRDPAWSVSESGTRLDIQGNGWKSIPVDYVVTENTVLEFEFGSIDGGEIHGIGLDSDDGINASRTFNVYGTQNWGITDAARYTDVGAFESFNINLGQYYTGAFDRLFFVNDMDGGDGSAYGAFRRIRLYESDSASAIAAIESLGFDDWVDHWNERINRIDGSNLGDARADRVRTRLSRVIGRIERYVGSLSDDARGRIDGFIAANADGLFGGDRVGSGSIGFDAIRQTRTSLQSIDAAFRNLDDWRF